MARKMEKVKADALEDEVFSEDTSAFKHNRFRNERRYSGVIMNKTADWKGGRKGRRRSSVAFDLTTLVGVSDMQQSMFVNVRDREKILQIEARKVCCFWSNISW